MRNEDGDFVVTPEEVANQQKSWKRQLMLDEAFSRTDNYEPDKTNPCETCIKKGTYWCKTCKHKNKRWYNFIVGGWR